MKNIPDTLKMILLGLLMIFVIGGSLYGCWVAKTVSYSFFYEDMVKETVTKMVKPGCLEQK